MWRQTLSLACRHSADEAHVKLSKGEAPAFFKNSERLQNFTKNNFLLASGKYLLRLAGHRHPWRQGLKSIKIEDFKTSLVRERCWTKSSCSKI